MNVYEKISKERKKELIRGNIPEWMTTGGYQLWKEKLRYQDESFKDAVTRVAAEAAQGLAPLADRFFTIIWKGWLAPSTPVLANLGLSRGLPVSCSGSYIDDSIHGFYSAYHEAAMLTKTGHGCSHYLGDIRPRGTPYGNNEGHADGVIPVIMSLLSTVTVVSQGATRRGATTFYIPVTHGDIEEVMDFHVSNPKRLQIGYIFDDAFICKLNSGDEDSVKLWQRFLEVRTKTGKAFMMFPDDANRHANSLGISFDSPILASNLCTEIFLPSNSEETFSCVLSSVNAYKYDEWEHDKEFIGDCVRFLNGIINSYIKRAAYYEGTEKIRRFTEKYRAIGLGVLGFTSYLQRHFIPFESRSAKWFNTRFFTKLREESREVGHLYDNFTVNAIAPNVSSALVCGGVSQGIEPFASNVFTQETAAGDIYRMNPELLKLMRKKYILTEGNIQTIKDNKGSIQGNPLFSEDEQKVFKTAYEIDMGVVIELANDRGQYIDQGQSLNLFFRDDADETYVSEVHQKAVLAPYIKSLYYFNTGIDLPGGQISSTCDMCAT